MPRHRVRMALAIPRVGLDLAACALDPAQLTGSGFDDRLRVEFMCAIGSRGP